MRIRVAYNVFPIIKKKKKNTAIVFYYSSSCFMFTSRVFIHAHFLTNILFSRLLIYFFRKINISSVTDCLVVTKPPSTMSFSSGKYRTYFLHYTSLDPKPTNTRFVSVTIYLPDWHIDNFTTTPIYVFSNIVKMQNICIPQFYGIRADFGHLTKDNQFFGARCVLSETIEYIFIFPYFFKQLLHKYI